MTDRTCEKCRQWAQMLGQPFLGICGATNRCTDKVDTCGFFAPREGENVVGREKIEEYLK